MDIESLDFVSLDFVEEYGQSQKLTDCIKNLLSGYKDGITIFKEIIQVKIHIYKKLN
jgi:hypothetical protein